MIGAEAGLTLEEGMGLTGMSYEELWIRQIALGGDTAPLEVEAYVLGLLVADPGQHDVLAQALNEWFMDHHGDHPVAYWNAATAY